MSNNFVGLFYAVLTMLVAIVLESLEIMWGSWSWIFPAWVLTMLLFWVSNRDSGFGIIMAWIFGMIMDVWAGTPLGQHCLLFIAASFIVTFMYKDFRLVEPLAQALVIAAIVLAYKLLNDMLSFGVNALLDISTLAYLGTGVASSIVWLILVLSFPPKSI